MAFALKTSARNAWLAKFGVADRDLARQLADGIRFVPDMELKDSLWKKLEELLSEDMETVAVFVEREQKHPGGKTQRLYKQATKKPKTAFGAAAKPVDPKLAYNPKVGSEGIIAQFTSLFCKDQPRALFHPTVAYCIKKKVRRFVLVTDIVGSGHRATDFLEAAWRTATLRSWHSYKRLRFEVVAFTATALGESVVRSHPSGPNVRHCLGCPTIASVFPAIEARRIRDLCLRYDPLGADPVESLGHKGTEALIAFAHSIPNNVPRLLFKGSHPLFRQQITRGQFEESDNDADLDARRLERLRQRRLAAGIRRETLRENARKTVVFLAASSRGPRTEDSLSRKTGLPIDEVRRMQALSQKAGWTDSQGRLTDSGHRELAHARLTVKPPAKGRLPGSEAPYYPQTLRTPF